MLKISSCEPQDMRHGGYDNNGQPTSSTDMVQQEARILRHEGRPHKWQQRLQIEQAWPHQDHHSRRAAHTCCAAFAPASTGHRRAGGNQTGFYTGCAADEVDAVDADAPVGGGKDWPCFREKKKRANLASDTRASGITPLSKKVISVSDTPLSKPTAGQQPPNPTGIVDVEKPIVVHAGEVFDGKGRYSAPLLRRVTAAPARRRSQRSSRRAVAGSRTCSIRWRKAST